jgi:hypothetical protein
MFLATVYIMLDVFCTTYHFMYFTHKANQIKNIQVQGSYLTLWIMDLFSTFITCSEKTAQSFTCAKIFNKLVVCFCWKILYMSIQSNISVNLNSSCGYYSLSTVFHYPYTSQPLTNGGCSYGPPPLDMVKLIWSIPIISWKIKTYY